MRAPARLALALVRGYQVLISPMLPPACRFTPSCSHYACACLTDHGFMRGSWLTLRRLARCHPWHPGGYDPPPPTGHVDPVRRAVGFDHMPLRTTSRCLGDTPNPPAHRDALAQESSR